MAMLGQSSFRRILLLRILLLSIPILFLGMAITFRKARTSLLTTARLNLEQSAVKKAEMIQNTVQSLQTSLAIATETAALQSGSAATRRALLNQIQPQLPTDVRCLQLKDITSGKLLASTCGNQVIYSGSTSGWALQENPLSNQRLRTFTLTTDRQDQVPQVDMVSQLSLVLSVPVYDAKGKLRYSLTAQAVLRPKDKTEPWLLQGYTVVIDQSGTFLAHPFPNRVGRNISQEPAESLYQDVLTNVQRGDTGAREQLNFAGDRTEWLAGFSPLNLRVGREGPTWAVLAVTRLDFAIQGLEQITQILLILMAGLLAAHLLAMLYMARDLALPIEQLGNYALRLHKRSSVERAPKNFKIRELNHLAEVLDNMVGRLEERAKELESAWQEAEAANQLKSEFLANTSHELRTPLNAIIGCIRLVKDDCCDSKEEEVEFLEQADKAAIHLLKIINDILDIQRIEEEKLPLSIELIDLRQILKEVIDLQVVQTQQKGLQLTADQLPEPIMVRADSARLKQVLLNVVYNAIKFTDRGGITISTRVEPAAHFTAASPNGISQNGNSSPASQSDQWIVIAVKDTGIGIDPAQQHKLFRPFVMVDGTTTRKFEGTGLGLAISRNLIEMMNGQISLHSDGINQGTTVEIALPIVGTSTAEQPAQTTEATKGTPAAEPSAIK